MIIISTSIIIVLTIIIIIIIRSHFGSSQSSPCALLGGAALPRHGFGPVGNPRAPSLLELTARFALSCLAALLVAQVMPHLRSAAASSARCARAVERGFLRPRPVGSRHILVPETIAPRVRTVVSSMALHRDHCRALQLDINTAAVAACRARELQVLSQEDLLHARQTHRAANLAKHSWADVVAARPLPTPSSSRGPLSCPGPSCSPLPPVARSARPVAPDLASHFALDELVQTLKKKEKRDSRLKKRLKVLVDSLFKQQQLGLKVESPPVPAARDSPTVLLGSLPFANDALVLADLPVLPSETRLLDDLGSDPPVFAMVQKPVEVASQPKEEFAVRESFVDKDALDQLRDSLMPMMKSVVTQSFQASNALFEQFLASVAAQQHGRMATLEASLLETQKSMRTLEVENACFAASLRPSVHEPLANVLKPTAAMEQQRRSPVTNVVKPAAERGCSVPVSDEEGFDEEEYAEYYKRSLNAEGADLAFLASPSSRAASTQVSQTSSASIALLASLSAQGSQTTSASIASLTLPLAQAPLDPSASSLSQAAPTTSSSSLSWAQAQLAPQASPRTLAPLISSASSLTQAASTSSALSWTQAQMATLASPLSLSSSASLLTLAAPTSLASSLTQAQKRLLVAEGALSDDVVKMESSSSPKNPAMLDLRSSDVVLKRSSSSSAAPSSII